MFDIPLVKSDIAPMGERHGVVDNLQSHLSISGVRYTSSPAPFSAMAFMDIEQISSGELGDPDFGDKGISVFVCIVNNTEPFPEDNRSPSKSEVLLASRGVGVLFKPFDVF